jgi:hypothetical protein
MKKTVIILNVLALFVLMAYLYVWNNSVYKKYDYPLNTIEAIKNYSPEIIGRDWFWYQVEPFQRCFVNWHLYDVIYTLIAANAPRVYLDIMITAKQIIIFCDYNKDLVDVFRENEIKQLKEKLWKTLKN